MERAKSRPLINCEETLPAISKRFPTSLPSKRRGFEPTAEKRTPFSSSSSRRGESANERMTWLEFNLILRTKRTEEEKYRYAYSVFVDRLRKMPMFIRKSDTPRKIRERLIAGGKIASKQEIDAITEAFEQIEYADRPATPETERALERLCEKIKENL